MRLRLPILEPTIGRGESMAGSDVFGDLRALRSSPPGWARAGKDRRAVFAAAIERSEQLLRTADALGYATRALNLFYGLSQAGRALMAAWSPPSAGRQHGWQLSGHGIVWVNAQVPLHERQLRGDLPEPPTTLAAGLGPAHETNEQPPRPKVVDKPQASFLGLSRLLGSAPLQRPVQLVDIWAALPEAIGRPAPGDDARLGPIQIQQPDIAPEQADWVVSAVRAWTHNWPLDPLSEWARGDGAEFNNRLHLFLLANYPTLAPPTTASMAEGWPVEWLGRRLSIALTWPLAEPVEQIEAVWHLQIQQTAYRGEHWAFPAFAGQELHPLMMWWIVLYGLSMLTRYEPRIWAQLLNVDASPWSTPLEHLLNEALTVVPQVIADTIRNGPGLYPDDEQPPD
jgi:hypothetical protein